MEYIKLESINQIATVTISREKAMNALNAAVLKELQEAFAQIEKDASIRVVILTGAGDKSFVAGADIAAMGTMSADQALAFAHLGHETMSCIDHCTRPVIAAVNGFCLGGGLELALACDFIYASEKAKLGLPEVKLGLFPGWGGTQRLPRLIGKARAKELIFCARILSAAEAHAFGIVNKVCAPETLLSEVQKVAHEIACKGPGSVRLVKNIINEGFDEALEDGLSLERKNFGRCFETADLKEGIGAFLEKRDPQFKGV